LSIYIWRSTIRWWLNKIFDETVKILKVSAASIAGAHRKKLPYRPREGDYSAYFAEGMAIFIN